MGGSHASRRCLFSKHLTGESAQGSELNGVHGYEGRLRVRQRKEGRTGLRGLSGSLSPSGMWRGAGTRRFVSRVCWYLNYPLFDANILTDGKNSRPSNFDQYRDFDQYRFLGFFPALSPRTLQRSWLMYFVP